MNYNKIFSYYNKNKNKQITIKIKYRNLKMKFYIIMSHNNLNNHKNLAQSNKSWN